MTRTYYVPGPIPTCLTRCCREWVAPVGFGGGRCGNCGTRPSFIALLPRDQWVPTPPPRRGTLVIGPGGTVTVSPE